MKKSMNENRLLVGLHQRESDKKQGCWLASNVERERQETEKREGEGMRRKIQQEKRRRRWAIVIV